MKYTLDSIERIEKTLEEKYKGLKAFSIPLLETNLANLIVKNDKVFYYGILTNGESPAECEVRFDDDVIITIVQNSQIEVLFTHLFQSTLDGIGQANLKGQFSGYIIQMIK